ncbi:unnamed protein product [Vitrella brassicaformis CCMP3155]|uniref:C3H1-type domain-containing protein n=1 Tax=Vitrella brassicaformis (strain CCMP3155) TaxID=1169540 RepID=A0A0G4E8V6_VITBC|nr:unnamed protein product [Vitrella brassicaformis CCMP3155]|eukprot:CEL91636.1 unnamed protein product [Vitrella brassicaformis CCMP3155]
MTMATSAADQRTPLEASSLFAFPPEDSFSATFRRQPFNKTVSPPVVDTDRPPAYDDEDYVKAEVPVRLPRAAERRGTHHSDGGSTVTSSRIGSFGSVISSSTSLISSTSSASSSLSELPPPAPPPPQRDPPSLTHTTRTSVPSVPSAPTLIASHSSTSRPGIPFPPVLRDTHTATATTTSTSSGSSVQQFASQPRHVEIILHRKGDSPFQQQQQQQEYGTNPEGKVVHATPSMHHSTHHQSQQHHTTQQQQQQPPQGAFTLRLDDVPSPPISPQQLAQYQAVIASYLRGAARQQQQQQQQQQYQHTTYVQPTTLSSLSSVKVAPPVGSSVDPPPGFSPAGMVPRAVSMSLPSLPLLESNQAVLLAEERTTPMRNPSGLRITMPNGEGYDVPRGPDGELLSIGSLFHNEGACRPCVFVTNQRKGGCQNGIHCAFCHYPHSPRRKPPRPSKRQRALLKALKTGTLSQSTPS